MVTEKKIRNKTVFSVICWVLLTRIGKPLKTAKTDAELTQVRAALISQKAVNLSEASATSKKK